MKISILHPSRSRTNQALQTLVHWLSNFSYQNSSWEYILSVDTDDPFLKEYEEFKSVDTYHGFNIIVNNNKNVVQASNQAAKIATGDIFILISDDFRCFKNWDIAIADALKGKSGVLKTFDGVQRWIVTLPIMTKDYYQECSYIYYPGYEHMFCDTDQTHRADLLKKLIIRNDIVFKHDHYSINGGQTKDDVNRKADKTWGQGQEVYLNRCKNAFGIADPVNIYNLSAEATKAGHIDWLKKKLRKGVTA